MKAVNFYYFIHDDFERGKRVRTTWRMTVEESQKWLNNPTPDLASLEVRMLPESEMEHAHTSCLAGPLPPMLDKLP
jgi:hypothetical protein